MKIVPAILSETVGDFLVRLRQAESFADYVQIDLMDGIFVPTRSFPVEKINNINTPLNFELHLMVKNPSNFMQGIGNSRLKKVIFHFESDVDHLNFINELKKRGLDAGLATKPETEIKGFREVAEAVDTLMFLTVDPCCYGHQFKPEVLRKIEEARSIFKDKTIAADGGVSLENLRSFYDIGVNYVCIVSRIFLESDPGENYRKFLKRAAELGS